MLFYSHTHPSLDDSDLLYLAIATGADPGFQVWGGALKKLCRAEGGAKIFGVFRVKNLDFTQKNHIFFQF
jgi:hypothetical protein